ncbi:hypothetical protein L208DRAFT_1502685, partial [Tricholoma matsutake]
MRTSSLYVSPSSIISDNRQSSYLSTKKKYKPVAQKVRPIVAGLPDHFRIIRCIEGDPLKDMPPLNPHPPIFKPTPRYNLECKNIIDQNHPGNFLWPQEQDLMHDFIRNQQAGFAWTENKRGRFRPNFFPLIEFPVIPHTLWVEHNIPIPPGLYEQICEMLKKKIEAGVYESLNSSYHLRWFCVAKKDAKSLRI